MRLGAVALEVGHAEPASCPQPEPEELAGEVFVEASEVEGFEDGDGLGRRLAELAADLPEHMLGDLCPPGLGVPLQPLDEREQLQFVRALLGEG